MPPSRRTRKAKCKVCSDHETENIHTERSGTVERTTAANQRSAETLCIPPLFRAYRTEERRRADCLHRVRAVMARRRGTLRNTLRRPMPPLRHGTENRKHPSARIPRDGLLRHHDDPQGVSSPAVLPRQGEPQGRAARRLSYIRGCQPMDRSRRQERNPFPVARNSLPILRLVDRRQSDGGAAQEPPLIRHPARLHLSACPLHCRIETQRIYGRLPPYSAVRPLYGHPLHAAIRNVVESGSNSDAALHAAIVGLHFRVLGRTQNLPPPRLHHTRRSGMAGLYRHPALFGQRHPQCRIRLPREPCGRPRPCRCETQGTVRARAVGGTAAHGACRREPLLSFGEQTGGQRK